MIKIIEHIKTETKCITSNSRYQKINKYLLKLEDSCIIEAIDIGLPDYNERRVLCLSCQVGCTEGCKICATSHLGFKRSLTTEELIEEAEVLINRIPLELDKVKLFEISFYGMGEPSLNYKNITDAANFLIKKYPNLKFNISTVGSNINAITFWAKNIKADCTLQISFHAPNNLIRTKIIPKKLNYEKIIEIAKKFYFIKKNKIIANYVLIKNINDSWSQIEELLSQLNKKYFIIRLAVLNKLDESLLKFTSPGLNKINKINTKIQKLGYETRIFYGGESDKKFSCGQLRYYKK